MFTTKYNVFKFMILLLGFAMLTFTACDDDDDADPSGPDPDATYVQRDQNARPAINTVFSATDQQKNNFNTTPPSQQAAAFDDAFEARLLALNPGYTTNALGLDADAFVGVLSTDVLNVATTGVTTFFDGTNVLTGRQLSDDVIDVELLLIFGGPAGIDNPGLTSDNVGGNDKAFLNSFPYLATPH